MWKWLKDNAAILALALTVAGIGLYQIESVRSELRAARAAGDADMREIRQSITGLVSAIHANDKRIDRLERAASRQ